MRRMLFVRIFLMLLGTSTGVEQFSVMAQQVFPGQIGVGIGLNQWNKPFVNIVHNARAFESPDGKEVLMDDNGWPMEDARLVLLEAWPTAEWWGKIDDPEAYHTDLSGTYLGAFSGQAVLSNGGGSFSISNINYQASTNQTTFELNIPEGANGLVILQFTGTRRTPSSETSSGITDLRVTRPGHDHQSEQVYNQTFLNALNSACFSTIRFTGFSQTNDNNPEYPERIEWNQRKKIDAATFHWTSDRSYRGAPWEYVIELGNVFAKRYMDQCAGGGFR